MIPTLTDLMVMSPELLLVVAAIVCLMAGAYAGTRATVFLTYVASAALVGALVLLLMQPAPASTLFGGLLRFDGFTIFVKFLIATGALLPLLLTVPWLRQEANRRFEYPVIILLATVGLMVMVSANNFLSLYMGLELASLALYVLAAIDRDNSQSSEAGLKYFVLGALASGMLLFGVSLIYGFSGTTGFVALASLLSAYSDQPASMGLELGLVLVIVGFCFKISAVPFHMWTPDVYEGAPTPVVTFFAVAPKVAALALLTRILMQPFGLLFNEWQPIIMVVSMASMAVGAFGALRQTNIKRLLAYSSIGHVGYALVGLSVGTVEGIQAMLIYLALYLFMSVGAFGFILHMRRSGKETLQLSDLGGLSKTCPKSALLLTIMMFSMAGIPPLAGFFGKFYVFLNAIEQGLYPLVIIGLLSSVVAAYYYIKLVKIMYFDEAKEPFDAHLSPVSGVVLVLCALVTTLFFIVPTPLIHLASQAAKSLAM